MKEKRDLSQAFSWLKNEQKNPESEPEKKSVKTLITNQVDELDKLSKKNKERSTLTIRKSIIDDLRKIADRKDIKLVTLAEFVLESFVETYKKRDL